LAGGYFDIARHVHDGRTGGGKRYRNTGRWRGVMQGHRSGGGCSPAHPCRIRDDRGQEREQHQRVRSRELVRSNGNLHRCSIALNGVGLDGKLDVIGSGGNGNRRWNCNQIGPVGLDGKMQAVWRGGSAYANQDTGGSISGGHLRKQPENDDFKTWQAGGAAATGEGAIERIAYVYDFPFQQASAAQQSIAYICSFE